jgi:SPP1 gp7 family putative phage head morphogenesis protein
MVTKAKAVTETRKKPDVKPIPGEVMFADTLYRLFGPHAVQRFNQNELISRQGHRTIRKMKADDMVKAALALKKEAVVYKGYEVVSPKGKPPDWEPTVFATKVLSELQSPVQMVTKEILSAFEYGFSITERIWGEKDGKIVYQALKTRSTYQVTFMQDGFGNLQSIIQENKVLPLDKFIVYVFDGEFDNPYGTPDLQAVYRQWWVKDNAYKWLAILLERMGIPPIFFLYDGTYSQPQQEKLKAIANTMAAATSGIIPRPSKDSLDVWAPELADNVAQVFIPAIEHLNAAIARGLLMPGLLGFGDNKDVGSHARSKTEFDVFMLVVEGIRAYIAKEIWNRQVIRPLIQLNFPVDEFPEFRWLPMDDEVKIDLYATWQALVSGHVVHPQNSDEKHIRAAFKMPEVDEKDRIEQEPSPDAVLAAESRLKAGQGKKFSTYSMTRYDSKTDFEAIDRKLMQLEDRSLGELRGLLVNMRDRLISAPESSMKKGGLSRFSESVTLRGFAGVEDAVSGLLRDATHAGDSDALKECKVKRYADSPEGAAKYMRQKAMFISGVLKDTLVGKAQNVLVNAIKTGAPVAEVVESLKAVFEPFVGDPNITRGKGLITPHRLQTIVRTNLTDAYNQARLGRFRELAGKGIVIGVQYSAIMDEKTTEVCQHLHGKVFKPMDPQLDKLAPPNHFNCRSILTPVMIGMPLNEKDFIKPSQAGKALELADERFYALEDYDVPELTTFTPPPEPPKVDNPPPPEPRVENLNVTINAKGGKTKATKNADGSWTVEPVED